MILTYMLELMLRTLAKILEELMTMDKIAIQLLEMLTIKIVFMKLP
jgi:hypothetical protein